MSRVPPTLQVRGKPFLNNGLDLVGDPDAGLWIPMNGAEGCEVGLGVKVEALDLLGNSRLLASAV